MMTNTKQKAYESKQNYYNYSIQFWRGEGRKKWKVLQSASCEQNAARGGGQIKHGQICSEFHENHETTECQGKAGTKNHKEHITSSILCADPGTNMARISRTF